MTQPTPDPVTLSCGCQINCDVIDGVNTMIVTACAAGEKCQYVRYVVGTATRQGKPPTVIG